MTAEPNTPWSGAFSSRRDFVRRVTGATLAGTLLPTIIPASALGKSGAVRPGNKIVLGVIGCGPQGLGDMANFLNLPDCQVVAVCDVKDDQLAAARNAVNAHYQNQDCRAYKDLRELVARPDIDACLIATPDHWHVLSALAAVNAGKDVYLEKPLAPALEQGLALRGAIQRKKAVFQFGTQQRSWRNFRLACELVRSGAIGSLQHINVWSLGSVPGGSLKEVPPPSGIDYDFWLGPAPYRPYTEDRCSADGFKKTWWFTSDYALGYISGWGIHPMDIALWGAEELLRGPVQVEGRGNFRMAEGICDTATIWEVNYTFASGLTVSFVGVPNGGNRGADTGEPFLHGAEWKQRYRRVQNHGTAFEGSSGWIKVDRASIDSQPGDVVDTPESSLKAQLLHSDNHARNFLDCVKSRAQTICPIDAAINADAMCHIADIAIRLNRKLTFDFATRRFLGDDSANHRLKARPMRKPWHL